MFTHNQKVENKVLFYLLSFTWGILWTLIGFLALAFVSIFFRKEIKITTVRGRIVVIFYNRSFGGASLGLVIFVDDLDENLVNHEIGHTIQNTWFGPLFIFLVAIPSGIRYQLWDRISTKHYKKYGHFPDYDRIWFEGQATYLGDIYK